MSIKELAKELHEPIIKNLKKEKCIYLLYVILGVLFSQYTVFKQIW